jgi:hypothetical protein
MMKEEIKHKILENVIRIRKTADRPKGLTNTNLRKNFGILSEKYGLWAWAASKKLHRDKPELVGGMELVIDEFLRQVQVYFVAHGIIKGESESNEDVTDNQQGEQPEEEVKE